MFVTDSALAKNMNLSEKITAQNLQVNNNERIPSLEGYKKSFGHSHLLSNLYQNIKNHFPFSP